MARPRNHSVAIIGLLFILIGLVSAVAIRVFLQDNIDADSLLTDDEQYALITELRDELSEVRSEIENAPQEHVIEVPLVVENGVYVRQSPRNGLWTLTVRYPAQPLTDGYPGFQLQYPEAIGWGYVTVDITIPTLEEESPYIALYTLQSATDPDYSVNIKVTHKELYDREKVNNDNIFAENGDRLLGVDETYAFLYEYGSGDRDIQRSIELLLSSFETLDN